MGESPRMQWTRLLWECFVDTDMLPMDGGRAVLPTKGKYPTVVNGHVQLKGAWKRAMAEAYALHGRYTHGKIADTALVNLHVTTWTNRRRKTGPMAGRPWIDTDACLWVAKDALKAAEILADDDQVEHDFTTRGYRPNGPAIRVELWSVL